MNHDQHFLHSPNCAVTDPNPPIPHLEADIMGTMDQPAPYIPPIQEPERDWSIPPSEEEAGIFQPQTYPEPVTEDQHYVVSAPVPVDPNPPIPHLEFNDGQVPLIIPRSLPEFEPESISLEPGAPTSYRESVVEDQHHVVPFTVPTDPNPEIPHLEADIGGSLNQPHPFLLPSKFGRTNQPVSLFAWIQCVQPQHTVEDFVAGGIGQHLTPHTTEVLFLPLAMAQYLLANRPTEYQQMTVVPGSITPSTDGSTGLDTLSAVSTQCWGIDSQTGVPYFSSDGDIGQNESAYVTVDSNGNVFLNR